MKVLLFVFAALLFTYVSKAQATYEIKGSVTDSASGKNLSYVTIALKNDKRQALKSILTKTDGEFSYAKLSTGKYFLSIVAMGYTSKEVVIDLVKDENLGKIYLSPSFTSLKAVSIRADKPLIKQDIDKITYDLQADPESKVNSVLEMMGKVPLLSLDHEDNIQLKGSGNYKILINGRPSSMLEKNPKDLLRSMPASTIQNIEVMTNPPAKYDGEGLAGIINIVTIKKVDNGYSGTININHKLPGGGPGLGASLNFKQGKLGLSANTGGRFFSDPFSKNFNSRQITGASASYLQQSRTREFNSENAYSTIQLSYELDSLNLVSVQLGYNFGNIREDALLVSSLSSPSSILEAYQLSNYQSGNRHGTDAALNYQLGFKNNKARLLTLSYKYLNDQNESESEAVISERDNYFLPDYLQFNAGSSIEQTVQADYVHPFKHINMEAGLKGIFRDNMSDFSYSSANSTGQYTLDPLLTNKYDNTQNVISLYNSWQLTLRKWGFKGGIRMEKTYTNANFVSAAAEVKQSYTNVLPSLSLTRTLKNKSTLGFGFSQRIKRPGIWELNPYVDRSNPNLERAGNPDLHLVVANNFQITYNRTKKMSVLLNLNHSFTNNALQYFILFNPSTNVNQVRIGNTGRQKSTGINMSLGYPITPKGNINFNNNLQYVQVEGYVEERLTRNQGFTGNFAVSSTYRFNRGWRLNTNVNYLLPPGVLLQGSGISIWLSGFSVQKDLLKEKLSLSASVNNPFTKYQDFPNNLEGANYVLVNNTRNYFRTSSFSVNYKFGKLKSAINKNKRGINNDDVSNNSPGGQ